MTSTRLRRDKLRFRPATLLPGCGIEQELSIYLGLWDFREIGNQSTQDRDSVIAKMAETLQIRVVTYNIHKCRGLDRRVSPSRIAEVLHKLSADCIALQEVVRTAATAEGDQAKLIAQALKELMWSLALIDHSGRVITAAQHSAGFRSSIQRTTTSLAAGLSRAVVYVPTFACR